MFNLVYNPSTNKLDLHRDSYVIAQLEFASIYTDLMVAVNKHDLCNSDDPTIRRRARLLRFAEGNMPPEDWV